MSRRKTANNGQLHEAAVFTVEGAGDFPFDMLRYDSCWPYSEGHDSSALSQYGTHGRERRRVVMQTYSPTAPTTGRWQSFGWRVVALSECRTEDGS